MVTLSMLVVVAVVALAPMGGARSDPTRGPPPHRVSDVYRIRRLRRFQIRGAWRTDDVEGQVEHLGVTWEGKRGHRGHTWVRRNRTQTRDRGAASALNHQTPRDAEETV